MKSFDKYTLVELLLLLNNYNTSIERDRIVRVEDYSTLKAAIKCKLYEEPVMGVGELMPESPNEALCRIVGIASAAHFNETEKSKAIYSILQIATEGYKLSNNNK